MGHSAANENLVAVAKLVCCLHHSGVNTLEVPAHTVVPLVNGAN